MRARVGSRVVMVRLRARLAAALRAELLGNDPRAAAAARAGLDELELMRGAIPTAELRARASAHGTELAMLGLRSAVRANRAATVLDWMERGRQASGLVGAPNTADPAAAALLGELRDVMARQRDAEPGSPDLRRLFREQAQLEARVQRRLRTADRTSPTRVRRVSPARLRDALGHRHLVALAEVDGRLLAVTVTARDTRLHRLGPAAPAHNAAQALAFCLRRMLRGGSERSRAAAEDAAHECLAELDAAVTAPLAARLGDAGEVVMVPTARLFTVPWHALGTMRHRLVTTAPSATAWWRAAQRTPDADGGVLVAAGPGLPGADGEAARVAALHPRAVLLQPPGSTVDAVCGALPGIGLAHLACHGRFRADNPSFSSLELSDGAMTVLDLEQTGATPERVVLAACDAGVSQVLPGEELRGFLSVLFALGTRSVVASAVPVPDLDSAELMVDMHRHLAGGGGMCAALHRARPAPGTGTADARVAALAFTHFGSA
ncbi:MAG: CHAT domain-containing protein [Thermoleophilia bacterium]